MLKVFRKTRFDQIAQKPARKYLFCALVEILLVVLGILLALQINNWNEAQKKKSYERYLLEENLANITEDEAQFIEILHQRRKAQSAIAGSLPCLKGTELQ